MAMAAAIGVVATAAEPSMYVDIATEARAQAQIHIHIHVHVHAHVHVLSLEWQTLAGWHVLAYP